MITKAGAAAALMLTSIFVITSCSGSGSSDSSLRPASSSVPTASSSASQSTAPGPATFTSATYGFRVTLPAGWTSTQASNKWNGQSGLTIDSPYVDQFRSASTPASFGVAAPWTGDLAAYTKFLVGWTAVNHGSTCPPEPATRSPITIGGQPGMLLAYNCGILINYAATVHSGVAYWFVFRDEGVDAATDPTDQATFLKMLKSVQFLD